MKKKLYLKGLLQGMGEINVCERTMGAIAIKKIQ